ncbi:LPXTG cell wall anchor domain-containing protein [Streptococcus mitis]|uniref:LPXTG cell wall anchor domain-containing protein n=1 Tax=Streptococcus mitis TaxID=28037 RepID=UPI0021B6E643|nr:LPXTG cell wall anchor domain-containing protein [Streptococcus mitis]
MNKKQVLATLALSTIALAQAGFVSADELEPIDSSAPATEVVTPTTPSAPKEAEAPATQPTEPSVTPVDPTIPSVQDKDNAGSLDGVPTDNPATSDKPQDKDNAGSLDGVPTPSDKPQDKDNAGSLDGVPVEKPKTTDEANEQGKSQIGTTSTSTGQVVHDVTKNPIETNTGASIVSTQDGNIVLSDGSVVTPEALGAVTNEDKTISVLTADGKMVTLPNTGTKQSFLAAIGGLLLTGVSYFYKKQLF